MFGDGLQRYPWLALLGGALLVRAGHASESSKRLEPHFSKPGTGTER